MAFEAVQPVFREIATASAVPQLSLARRDREVQVEEGQPPMEVASVEQEALRWQKNEDLREKWQKRQSLRNSKRQPASDDTHATPDDTHEDDEGSVAQLEPMQENMEFQEHEEDEETGTLFDSRL